MRLGLKLANDGGEGVVELVRDLSFLSVPVLLFLVLVVVVVVVVVVEELLLLSLSFSTLAGGSLSLEEDRGDGGVVLVVVACWPFVVDRDGAGDFLPVLSTKLKAPMLRLICPDGGKEYVVGLGR